MCSRHFFFYFFSKRRKIMNTKLKQWVPVLFVCLITMVAFSAVAVASEFSADFVMKGGPMSGKGKIWVKGNKMRQEFGDQFGKMITIIDLDQGMHWKKGKGCCVGYICFVRATE
jgi:hypothetical protein